VFCGTAAITSPSGITNIASHFSGFIIFYFYYQI
jgi:hypothetical protein